MRIKFTDIGRPKAAAKQLSRMSSALTLSRAQEAVARVSGYRDWHELSNSPDCASQSAAPFDLGIMTSVVLTLAELLELESGDVQYALSKTRFVGQAPWSSDDQLALFMAAMRSTCLGAPARGKPGTVVKVKGFGPKPGYILRTDDRGVMHLLFDSGEGACVPYEAVTPRIPLPDFLPARLWLPYGIWTLQDGSDVAFSRDYLPLWRVDRRGVERLDPWLWINGAEADRWFAQNTEGDWWRPAAREAAMAYLARHRIFELPKLANAMRYLFEPGVETRYDALRRLYQRSDSAAPLPKFATLRRDLIHDWRTSRTEEQLEPID